MTTNKILAIGAGSVIGLILLPKIIIGGAIIAGCVYGYKELKK